MEAMTMEARENQRLLKNGNPSGKGGYFARVSKEELQELGRKGKEAKERNKKKLQTAKEVLQALLASDSTDKEASNIVQGKNLEATEQATLLFNMMKKASRSAQMAELVFKLTGDISDQPQQNITIVNQLSDEQLLAERQKILGGQDIIDVTPRPPELE
jgi:hypothetical protein